MDLCFKIAYNTGVQPNAIGPCYKEWVELGKYLKMGVCPSVCSYTNAQFVMYRTLNLGELDMQAGMSVSTLNI
jgi:hypothetical protein